MHEISLCEGILEIMAEQASVQGFSKVKRVWVEIGALSCASPEAMCFCFNAVMKGTLAEGAVLKLVRVPGRATCLLCLLDIEIGQYGDLCPNCGSYRLEINDGDQLKVRELEVE